MTRDSSALLVFLPLTSCLRLQHARAQYVRHFNSSFTACYICHCWPCFSFWNSLSVISFSSLSFSAHTFKMLGQVWEGPGQNRSMGMGGWDLGDVPLPHTVSWIHGSSGKRREGWVELLIITEEGNLRLSLHGVKLGAKGLGFLLKF